MSQFILIPENHSLQYFPARGSCLPPHSSLVIVQSITCPHTLDHHHNSGSPIFTHLGY